MINLIWNKSQWIFRSLKLKIKCMFQIKSLPEIIGIMAFKKHEGS